MMTIDEALKRPSVSVPIAGKLFFGLERNGSYEAAKRGDIPVIRIGRRMVVPVALLAQKLGLETKVGVNAQPTYLETK